MPSNHSRATDHITDLLAKNTQEELLNRLKAKHHQSPTRVPGGTRLTPEALESRWKVLSLSEESKETILDARTFEEREVYQKNIENFIGTVKVPIGLIGPLRVNGLFAQGDYYVPLATTEAALVASYNRGAQVITEAGGCAVALISEGVSRAPSFAFQDLGEAGQFAVWAISQLDKFTEIAATTTRHGKLVDMRTTIEGNHVYINFEYMTGDASGQNMVTISTEAICLYIEENSPVKPQYWFIESNMS